MPGVHWVLISPASAFHSVSPTSNQLILLVSVIFFQISMISVTQTSDAGLNTAVGEPRERQLAQARQQGGEGAEGREGDRVAFIGGSLK